jgi:hypothetical protein
VTAAAIHKQVLPRTSASRSKLIHTKAITLCAPIRAYGDPITHASNCERVSVICIEA